MHSPPKKLVQTHPAAQSSPIYGEQLPKQISDSIGVKQMPKSPT